MVIDMPMLTTYYVVPFPGFVDIYLQGMTFRFSKESIEIAIGNVKRDKDTFATEAAYMETLNIYEVALKQLEESNP